MNSDNRTCPVCGEGTLTPETYSEQMEHNGKLLTVSGLERYRCSQCDADPVLRDQIRRNQVRLCDARRLADGFITGEQIRALRERLGLSQPEAAGIFGGGANAFSKYERGEVIQSLPMDRLLRCAEAFPLLVDVLRRVAGLDAHTIARVPAYIQTTTDAPMLNDPHYTSKPIPGARAVVVSRNEDTRVVTWKRAA